MKRIISLILSALLLLTALTGSAFAADPAGSGSGAEDTGAVIRIAGLKGPTSMGLVRLMEESENGSSVNTYEFTLAGSADEVTPKLIKGELDIAAVPANLASVLYNNTNGAIRLLAVNTLGVLYVLEKGDSVHSVADLRGKTIYATGKGSTPEYTLRYILQENGIDPDKDVKIEFKSEPTEVVQLLAQADNGIAMLPQPYVTVAQGAVEGLHTVIDLTEAWNELDNGSMLITGVLAARADFVDSNKEAVEAFLSEYRDSAEYAVSNPAETAQLIEKYGIVKAAVAEKALPYCNLTYLAGEDLIAPLSGYLAVLLAQNPKAVGGKLPGDDFYYIG